jgi:hypothetical protein
VGNALWSRLDQARRRDQQGKLPTNQNSELKLALMSVVDAGRDVNANRLTAFLARYGDRPLAGFKFMSRTGHAGQAVAA